MTDLIRSKLDATRRRHVAFATGSGAAMAACAFAGVLGATMFLDWWIELPTSVRATLLAINLAIVAYLLVRYVIVPAWAAPDDDQVALWVEAHAPQLNSRLIAAVQLARPGALAADGAIGLVRETVKQAHHLARSIDFTAVVRPDRLRRWTVILALSFITAVSSMVIGGRSFFALLGRALLVSDVEVPRRTRVELLTKDRTILPRGEPVTLRVRAIGVIPADGWLDATFLNPGGSTRQRYALLPDAGKPDEFSITIDNVQTSFDYVVRLNDGHSAQAHVEAVDRPTATRVQCVQTYPPYTKLPEQPRSPGDLTLVAGSRLTVRVTTNKPVRREPAVAVPGEPPVNRIHLVGTNGAERDVPLVPESSSSGDRTHLVTLDAQGNAPAFAVPNGSTGFSIHLTDENGFTTKDPAVYRIDVVPDKPPVVRVTSPARKEDLVTRRATIDVGIDASDDFGVAKLALAYKVVATFEEGEPGGPNAPGDQQADASGAMTTTTIVERYGQIPLDVPLATARAFKMTWPLRIARLTPPVIEGQTVEWWVEAEDANDLTGPGKAASEHYVMKVVTDAEKRADLLSRLGDYLGQINELSESQREASDQLGNVLRPTTAPSTEP